MNSIQSFFENLKENIKDKLNGFAQARHARANRPIPPAEPARPDSPQAAERKNLYTYRARPDGHNDGANEPAEENHEPAAPLDADVKIYKSAVQQPFDNVSDETRPFLPRRQNAPAGRPGVVLKRLDIDEEPPLSPYLAGNKSDATERMELSGIREDRQAGSSASITAQGKQAGISEPIASPGKQAGAAGLSNIPGGQIQPGNTPGQPKYSIDGRTERGTAGSAPDGKMEMDHQEDQAMTGQPNDNNAAGPGPAYLVDKVSAKRAGAAGAAKAVVPPANDDNPEADKAEKVPLFHSRYRPPNALLGVAFTTLQLVVFALLLIGVLGVGAVVGIAKAYADTAPVLDVGKIQNQDLTSFIYDGNGKLITTFAGMENRVWATIDEIPKNLQNAAISIEDARFMTHKGIDYKRIVGAFFSNMSSDSSQGGSTITQQLIKNTMISSERTYKRKIQEAWLAMQLETKYSKMQILEAYLNTIPLGESNYGVKAAAQDYFGKSLDKLSLRECAMLAGLTQSPYLYDPRRNTYTRSRMDITNKRTNTVLMCMYEQGYIDKGQFEEALRENVVIQPKSDQTQMYDMPFFVEYAIDDIKTHLLKSRNLEDTTENRSKMDTELRTGGYKIYLTVDPQIQKDVEDTLYNWKKYPKMQISKDSNQIVSDGSGGTTTIVQPQAAAVVLDYHTGQLKAIVGGRQQPKMKRTLNRAYQSHMPVGSCIKPIAVYGPAVDMGLSPASIIYNVPAAIKGWNDGKGGKGYPSNFSGTSFTGPISMRKGLINSYNVVAAHLLLDDVGLDNSVAYLKKLGIKSTINKDGPGLALGTTGITLIEMTGAFGTFGNKGEYIEPLSFTKILDAKGGVVLDAEKIRVRTQVFKPSTAWMMISMMSDVINKGTATKAKIPGMNLAGKTGTNSDYKGVSFNGLSPYYSAAVWVGSDAYRPLYRGATGGADAAPIWQAFMKKIHADKKLANKEIIPDTPASLGLVQATVCGVSGLLKTDACTTDPLYKPVTDWFLKGTAPTDTCNMHYQMKVDQLSGLLATPFCPASEVKESSILIVPQDSIIRKMSPADITKYFPNAVLNFPGVDDLSQFTYDNPDYAQYFCPIHTQEWADLQPQYTALVNQCNLLISNVKTKMSYIPITQSVRAALNARIKTIQTLITKGFTDPTVPAQTVYQNLANAYTDLQSYATSVLIEPTPTPTPEPTIQPTDAPTTGP